MKMKMREEYATVRRPQNMKMIYPLVSVARLGSRVVPGMKIDCRYGYGLVRR
jgi:hypothetical protein